MGMKAEYIIKIDGEPDIMGNYPLKDKPQELVRCKDCKHFERYYAESKNGVCNKLNIIERSEDWFCADGKRRTDDD